MVARNLIIEFCGQFMIRQPTDPDPYDEAKGASGYTFSFGNEPPLNREIYYQEHKDFPVRSHCLPVGVNVRRAYIADLEGDIEIDILKNARVELLESAKLENRNWALTKPGFEPIVPFNIQITSLDGSFQLQRRDVLDPENPTTDIMDLPQEAILTKGARGLEYEPSTVGFATGHRDAYIIHKRRRKLLWDDLQEMENNAKKIGSDVDDPAITILRGRIAELDIGIKAVEGGKPDKRTMAYSLIERFGYFMSGEPGSVNGKSEALQGNLSLDAEARWRVDYWMGGWSCDALCAYTEGTLQIPYKD